MPVPGLFDIVIFLEHIDQRRADAVESAVRAAWRPIHTDWAAPRYDDEGLVEMRAVGYIIKGSVEDLLRQLREAVITANGRACQVDFWAEEVITFPGVEYVFGPRGRLRTSSLAPKRQSQTGEGHSGEVM